MQCIDFISHKMENVQAKYNHLFNISKFVYLEAPNSAAIVSRRFSAKTFAASRFFKCILVRYRCRGCCEATKDVIE